LKYFAVVRTSVATGFKETIAYLPWEEGWTTHPTLSRLWDLCVYDLVVGDVICVSMQSLRKDSHIKKEWVLDFDAPSISTPDNIYTLEETSNFNPLAVT
jgi:hypothetical protein